MLIDELYHSGRSKRDGAPVGSGRYPLGSGDDPFQHERDFMDRVNNLKREGYSEVERAKLLGFKNTDELRKEVSLASGRVLEANRCRARELYLNGMSKSAIGREMGVGESTVRGWLQETTNRKQAILDSTVDVLKKNLDDMRYVDISKGVAESMGITETRLKTAVAAMKKEGYEEYTIYIPQAGGGNNYTPTKVLALPGVERDEINHNKEKIGVINARFDNPNGVNELGLKDIKAFPSDRLQIVYGDKGGDEKDGVIELRRGAEGLDMGKSMYAQVRISVDGTHYLKGMAIYSDDLPDGVDIRFNTNKKSGTPMTDVLKPMKMDDPNPFGASIKTGGQRGYLNIVNEEGDWSKWSKTLASQMLSKQPVALAKRQLDLAAAERKAEFDEIKSLTNPTVRKYMLEEFAESCDTAARNLKAAAMPQQASHVILPVNSLKPNEIYAPNYKNGEKVVLIRYPHGGIFEIPELRVNNNNPEAKRIFENAQTGLKAPDAVGIHYSVAAKLSGADFDGDTVLVIPNRNNAIRTKATLPGLRNFDPHGQYPYYKGMKVISKKHMAKEMGCVSNLITDMTIKNASDEELARAVRYSMVVIDSYKHKLNYRQARIDNNIDELERLYQRKDIPTPGGKEYGGASTLISRAKSEERVPERKQGRSGWRTDPETGAKVYLETGRHYEKMRKNKVTGEWESTGKTIFYETKSTKMDEAKDARTLSSGTPIEETYARYANQMKAMANAARKEAYFTEETPYSAAAYAKYKEEADSIKRQVQETKSKLPLERKAQAMASRVIRDRIEDEANGLPYREAVKVLETERVKKIRAQAIAGARAQIGSKRPTIDFTDREWEAIQAGAVSKTTFKEALRYADQDKLKERAMPRQKQTMSASKKALAKAKLTSGYTQKEVAEALGVSLSTIQKIAME